jgi:hypothetical protein
MDGRLVIDHWDLHGATDDVARVDLVAGRGYDVRMEFFEHTGLATAKLWWAPPGQGRAAIAADRLSHDEVAADVLAPDEPAPRAAADEPGGPIHTGLGCALGGTGDGAGTLLVLGAGLLARARRRRGRASPAHRDS